MKKPFKRKRIIEIYFVLYLMALILILPSGKDDDNGSGDAPGTGIIDFPYSLKPVSNVLNAKILISRDTMAILNIDSINTIYYTGEVEDIDFEFVVEDLSINSELRISEYKAESNKYFKIKEDRRRQAAVFTWLPPTSDPRDKTFMVTVNAKIKPKTAGEVPEDIVISTDFSINVDFVTPHDIRREMTGDFYVDDIPGYPGQEEAIGQVQIPQVRMNTGDLSIFPGHNIINSLAGEEWSNHLIVTGIDLQREMRGEPRLIVEHSDESNGGNARFQITPDNGIIISGTAPDYGSNKIRMVITRYDGKTVETEFPVVLKMIGTPEMPKVMYPEITYIIDPMMPALTTGNSYSLLKTSGGREISKAIGSQKIRFTPAHSDTGTSVYVERYINNRSADKTRKCRIIGNPAPTITYVQKISDTEVKIGTFSRGFIDGRQNITEKLILTGNAEYYSLSGQLVINNRKHTYEQSFMINPKDDSKPFTFTVQAVSVEGKKSESKEGGSGR
jgi:hypothetical protein